MENFDKVLYPTEEEKDRSIAGIVENGVVLPRRLSSAIAGILKEIGVRELFFGVGDCVFLAFLGAVLFWMEIFSSVMKQSDMVYLLLFFSSPFLYGLLHLLTVWKDIMTGTYEQLMTLKISLRRMTVLRMFVFGGVCVVLTAMAGFWFYGFLPDSVSVFKVLGLSFTSLFLFAWMELVVEWKWRKPFSCLVVPAVWIVLGILLTRFEKNLCQIIEVIPTVVFMMTAAVFAMLYYSMLKTYYFDLKEGVVHYVVN